MATRARAFGTLGDVQRLALSLALVLAGCTAAPMTSATPVREAFEQAAGHPRLVLILSPTCPVCTSVVDSLQHELEAHPDADVQVLVVYSKFLRWDRLGLRESTRARLHDSRVRFQVWDPEGHVAASLCTNPAGQAMCTTSPRLFGWVGWWPAGAAWGWPSWTAWDALPSLG